MPRIYVDLDDVLAQTGKMFLRVLSNEFGREVEFDEILTYHLGDSFDLGPDELEEFMRVAHEPGFLESVEPMPGAREALASWQADGYEVWIVTGRPPTTRAVTEEWLERQQMPHDAFRFLDKLSAFYDGAHGTSDGALTLADLPRMEFCLAVEDFPGIVPHLAGEVGIPVALFDRPWNRSLDGDGIGALPVVRCRNWSEIRERFASP